MSMTLNEEHSKFISYIDDKRDKIKELNKKLEDAKNEQRREKIMNKIKSLGNPSRELMEYLSRVSHILIKYYDITEGKYYAKKTPECLNEKPKSAKPTTSVVGNNNLHCLRGFKKKKQQKSLYSPVRQTSIGNFRISKTIDKFINFKSNANENLNLQNDYDRILKKKFISSKLSPFIECADCKIEKIFMPIEGSYVCEKCGKVEYILLENNSSFNLDGGMEKQRYPYKEENHLREKLDQFQAKENTIVPNEVINKIIDKLKKKRISISLVKKTDIRQILKELKYSQYYENINQIYYKITDKPPFSLPKELETEIIEMFHKTQKLFKKHRPSTRTNFLSYSYILNKFFLIKEYPEYSIHFPLLKSTDKLKEQDKIWKKICKDACWKFYPSI